MRRLQALTDEQATCRSEFLCFLAVYLSAVTAGDVYVQNMRRPPSRAAPVISAYSHFEEDVSNVCRCWHIFELFLMWRWEEPARLWRCKNSSSCLHQGPGRITRGSAAKWLLVGKPREPLISPNKRESLTSPRADFSTVTSPL